MWDLFFELKIQEIHEIHFLAIFAPKLFAEIRFSILPHLVLDCWSDLPFSNFRMMHGLGEQEGGRFGTGLSNREISRVISFLHNFCSNFENLENFRFSPESSKNLRTDALFQNCELLSSLENNSGNGTPGRFAMGTLCLRPKTPLILKNNKFPITGLETWFLDFQTRTKTRSTFEHRIMI